SADVAPGDVGFRPSGRGSDVMARMRTGLRQCRRQSGDKRVISLREAGDAPPWKPQGSVRRLHHRGSRRVQFDACTTVEAAGFSSTLAPPWKRPASSRAEKIRKETRL